MEIMSEFKVGDNIVRVKNFAQHAPKGYKTTILKSYKYLDADGDLTSFISEYWELAKPKWSIYNNYLPWEKLSDKQKGEMLLAELDGIPMNMIAKSLSGGDSFISCEEIDSSESVVYRARTEPVKPKPTMAELFIADWKEFGVGLFIAPYMIAKGWAKPCLEITKSEGTPGEYHLTNSGQITAFDSADLTITGCICLNRGGRHTALLTAELVKEATQLMIEHGIVITNETDKVGV